MLKHILNFVKKIQICNKEVKKKMMMMMKKKKMREKIMNEYVIFVMLIYG
jgi:hypothetical protein